MVVVNAEGALGGYPRLRLIVKTRGEGEGELSISLVPLITELYSPDSFQTATTSLLLQYLPSFKTTYHQRHHPQQ